MTTIKNVVLIGVSNQVSQRFGKHQSNKQQQAGGNLGPSVLAPFLNSSFKVTVLSREGSKSTFPPEATVVKTDYSPSSLASAFKDQDAVISIVGTAGFADQVKFIDAAVAAGVKRFIPSEFGSDTANDAVRAIVPIFNGKKQVVDYLRSKESSTFSWTAFITGLFFDWVSTLSPASTSLFSFSFSPLLTSSLLGSRKRIPRFQHRQQDSDNLGFWRRTIQRNQPQHNRQRSRSSPLESRRLIRE